MTPKDEGKHDLPAAIPDNGFLISVSRAVDVDMVTGDPNSEVNESILGWQVIDILNMRGENQEGVAA